MRYSTTKFITQYACLLLIASVTTSSVLGQSGSRGFGSRRGPVGPGASRELPRYQAPVFEIKGPTVPVVDVKIIGNKVITEDKVRTYLQTRAGRGFDAEVVQADVRKLSSTGMFRNVRTYKNKVKDGVIVTFEVFELPIIGHVRFVGNTKLKDKLLRKRAELKVGESIHRYRVEEARRKLQELYVERGYSDAQVEIQEGDKPDDQGVVFSIYEGKLQRILQVKFVGNTVASDGRLKTQIQSKPGILWYFKGKVDKQKIDEDVQRLTAYYRSLGYFKARIGRTLDFGDSGKWLTLTFVIDEGPRYQIRNVSIIGNEVFTTDDLLGRLEIKAGEYFDSRKMNADMSLLQDIYGSQGYIHSDIKADPRFLEQPGMIDLVYDIDEGEQYRVGKIIVNIEGENPHTRRSVVVNRISLAPNDIIDIREIRASERRLRSSQLFLSDPARGVVPTIAVKPPELSDSTLAERPGQSNSPY